MKRVPRRALSLVLSLALVAGGCSRDLTTSGDLSRLAREEIQVGERIDHTIRSQFYVYTEPGVNAYVTEVGQKVLAARARRHPAYRFTVLYSDKVHATSAPGGFVYLTTGMLNFLENEAELAAVLGHEIAHLEEPRLAYARRRDFFRGVSLVSFVLAPLFGIFGLFLVAGAMVFDHLSDVPPPEQAVTLIKADRQTLRDLAASGYEPQALESVLMRLQAPGPEVAVLAQDYLSHRPVSRERLQELARSFARLPLEGKSLVTGRERYLEAMRPVQAMYRA